MSDLHNFIQNPGGIPQSGPVMDNTHHQHQPVDGTHEVEGTFRASGPRPTQTVTPSSYVAGPSAAVTPGLPDGETPETWFAKSQSHLNMIYAQLRAQQGVAQVPRQ